MLPATIQLPPLKQGDTWHGFTIPRFDRCGENMPEKLVSAELSFRLRDAPANQPAALILADEITIVDAAAWHIEVGPVHYDFTQHLQPGVYNWDLQTTDAADVRRTTHCGSIEVIADTTRPAPETLKAPHYNA